VSLTAAVWALLAGGLGLRSLQRPVYAIALYLLTFWAAPQLWWWGLELPTLRYALYAGIILLVSVAFHSLRGALPPQPFTWVHRVAIACVVNATFVHLALATDRAISLDTYVELLKYTLLFFLLWRGIEDKRDFRVVLMTMALGAAYIGYEVTINERGSFSRSRLEGVGAPSADTSNGLASLLMLVLPLIGSLFMNRSLGSKILVVVAAPLALNTLLLCNSRGAFLGLIGAGLLYFLLARGAARKEAFRTLLLGAVVLYLLLGDPDILNRFMTTFVGSEDRDQSAASRLNFWSAGLLMLADYPLGAGGAGFKYVHGAHYLQVLQVDEPVRSLHNGFMTEVTDWGIQGLSLRILFIVLALAAAYRTSNICRRDGRPDDAIVGNCLIVAAFGFLITCIFGSFLSNEWAYWILALLVRYSELYRVAEPAVSREPSRTVVPHPAAAGRPPVPVHVPAARSR
jgi:O-antigen ligase